MIVGTAGHVDHGKTSLVRALTGVDTDRLAEEKARGISIELGFAYARLAGDDAAASEPIGFVDVPGHRRFVQTMIAGAAGIDVALLVVAADDGPMPQTREHVAILRWLGIPRLVVALTKIDRVDRARIDEASRAVATLLDGTAYRDAAIVPLSVVSGAGVAALTAALRACRTSTPTRPVDDGARFRLAIDRAFVLDGIGLVVTGTALAGRVTVDDNLVLLPGGLVARVRSIHAQNAATTTARAGQRVALNLVGRGVEKSAVRRGDWLVAPSVAVVTERIDVALAGPHAFDPRTWRAVRFHAGADARNARVMLLGHGVPVGGDFTPVYGVHVAPLAGRIAQIVFDEPAHVLAGDRFVLRDASAADGNGSIAGGVVLDVDVPARGRRGDARLAFLDVAAAGNARATLAAAIAASAKGVDLGRWNAVHNTAFGPGDFADAHAVETSAGTTLFATDRWHAMRARVLDVLADEHVRAPDTVGPGRDRLRRMALPTLDAATFGALVDGLKAEGRLTQTAAWLHLPGHRVALSSDDRRRFERAQARFDAGEANNPPRVRDLARALDEDEASVRTTFVRLAALGEVYRVAHDHYFRPATVKALARDVAELAARDGVARAAPFRDRIGVGRKVAIQILEFFDRVGYTRRTGDDHRVIHPTLFDD